MKENPCPNEGKVMHAARTGCWDEYIQTHLAQCGHCREIAETITLLRTISADDAESPIPDAQMVWWNAQLDDRQRITQKALRPLAVANFAAAIILVLLGTAALLRGLQFLSSGWPSKGPQVLQPAFISIAALVICSVILVLLRVLTPVFNEE
jgi:hypothetical protein